MKGGEGRIGLSAASKAPRPGGPCGGVSVLGKGVESKERRESSYFRYLHTYLACLIDRLRRAGAACHPQLPPIAQIKDAPPI
ncbi:hypothetical protein GQ53DRAFT_745257 [Thozetella sp. PMI_491]|nr:hypothetical protein GQ53DRAFT_745257 [Thozetella sp. PMI_491]